MPLFVGAVGVGDAAVLETSIFAGRAGVVGEVEDAVFTASALAARAGAVGLASAEVEDGAVAGDA